MYALARTPPLLLRAVVPDRHLLFGSKAPEPAASDSEGTWGNLSPRGLRPLTRPYTGSVTRPSLFVFALPDRALPSAGNPPLVGGPDGAQAAIGSRTDRVRRLRRLRGHGRRRLR